MSTATPLTTAEVLERIAVSTYEWEPGNYCPFEHADALGIQVVYCDLETHNLLGLSKWYHNPAGPWMAIFLDETMLSAERRSTVAHELAHIEIEAKNPGRLGGGLDGICRSVERECDLLAAERLISFEALKDAYAWADCVYELADALNVDPTQTLLRLGSLTDAEYRQLRRSGPFPKVRFSRPLNKTKPPTRGQPLKRKKPLGHVLRPA